MPVLVKRCQEASEENRREARKQGPWSERLSVSAAKVCGGLRSALAAGQRWLCTTCSRPGGHWRRDSSTAMADKHEQKLRRGLGEGQGCRDAACVVKDDGLGANPKEAYT